MTVLVLGGTGAMGTHLVKLLADNNIDISVTTRTSRRSGNSIRYLQGNARDIKFIQSVLQVHWDVIVDFMVYNTEEFKERVDGFLTSTTQYVFLSSARVYAESVEPISENSPRLLDTSSDKNYLSTDEYALTKARQEDILKNSKYRNWTVIRPYITYSEIRLQLGVMEKEDWLYRAMHGRTIVFSDDISMRLTTLTYGLDVAEGIFKIIGKANAIGEVFHITSNKALSWNNILTVYLDILEKWYGARPKILMCKKSINLRYEHLKYQVLYDRHYDRCFDNSKISQYLDINNFTQTEEGVRKCLELFLQEPRFNYINWVAEAVKDRQTGEHTPLKEIQGWKNKIRYLIERYFK